MRLMIARLALLALALAAGEARAQTSDAALRDRVLQLVERLETPKMEARKAAEEALTKLGPRILPVLPVGAKAKGEERRQRLDLVRAALLESQAAEDRESVV